MLYFYKGANFFYLAAEIFGHSGQKMLKRVGNTVKMLLYWVKVSKAIMAEDQVGATVEKTKLEESQRSALRCLTQFYIPDPNFFHSGFPDPHQRI